MPKPGHPVPERIQTFCSIFLILHQYDFNYYENNESLFNPSGEINNAPQMRFTKDNQTPIAEMMVNFAGLRDEDPQRELNGLGDYICSRNDGAVKEGQSIVIEGRLRMNSVTRKDEYKEKQPELTASRIHHITPAEKPKSSEKNDNARNQKQENSQNSNWNSAPLVPEVDEKFLFKINSQ